MLISSFKVPRGTIDKNMAHKFLEFLNCSVLLYLSDLVKVFGEVQQLLGISIQILIAIIYLYNFITDLKRKKNERNNKHTER